jgi:hypothetical protein
MSWRAASGGVSPGGWQDLQRLARIERLARTRAPSRPTIMDTGRDDRPTCSAPEPTVLILSLHACVVGSHDVH